MNSILRGLASIGEGMTKRPLYVVQKDAVGGFGPLRGQWWVLDVNSPLTAIGVTLPVFLSDDLIEAIGYAASLNRDPAQAN